MSRSPPDLSHALAHVDLWLIIRITKQAHVVAVELGNTSQPEPASFDSQVLRRHRSNMCIPDAHGVVPRRRDDARPVGAEGDRIDGVLMPAQDRDLLAGGGVPDARGVVSDAVTIRVPSWLEAAD
jgi:hypothetical protein